MKIYYTSADSRHFVEVGDGVLSVIKNGKKIQKAFPFIHFTVCGLGNNGNLIIKNRCGVFVINIANPEMMYPVNEYSLRKMRETVSMLGEVKVNNKGTLLCVEKINYKSRLIDVILRKVKGTLLLPKAGNHQFISHNLQENIARNLFVFSMAGKEQNMVQWNISPNFKYMILVERPRHKSRGGSRTALYIINLATGNTLTKFEISDAAVKNININNLGVCFFEMENGVKEYVILTTNGKLMRFNKDSASKLLHFGTRVVVYKKVDKPRLIIKDLSEKVICEANLEPLEKLNFEYDVSFNEEDDINLIVSKDGRVKMLNCHLNNFQYDLKRWEFLANGKWPKPADEAKSAEKNTDNQRETNTVGARCVAPSRAKQKPAKVSVKKTAETAASTPAAPKTVAAGFFIPTEASGSLRESSDSQSLSAVFTMDYESLSRSMRETLLKNMKN